LEEQPLLLATLPPDSKQKRLAIIVALLLLGTFAAAFPFRNIQLSRIDAFIPIVDAILLVGDSITAALLFAQFSLLRSRALLALAGGYLFTALIIIPHALTFPGTFSPTGLLGAGLQTTAWIYVFWHMGLPTAVIAYSILRPVDDAMPLRHGNMRFATVATVLGVAIIVCGLTGLATVGADFLPAIMSDQMRAQFPWHFIPPVALSVAAIALVWVRRRSVLDLWLLIVLVAWLLDSLLLNNTVVRFSLIWYAGRTFGLLAASFVLLILLSETTVLYIRLAVSASARQRERESRLMTMDAVAASIAHEVKQPLSAIVTNASVGLLWFERPQPDLKQVVALFKKIVDDGHRASDVIDSIRAMFGKHRSEKGFLDVNALVHETLSLVRRELEMQRVSLQLELSDELPQVLADRVQIQQTFLNLFTNAVEAMNPVTDRARSLSVKSERRDLHDVLLTVQDTGIGIDRDHADRIFDAFFTTKSSGTGMGLSLCRSIVEAHGGRLWASARTPHGSTFFLRLPGAAPSQQ
jgi:signal transduction histidine kinase